MQRLAAMFFMCMAIQAQAQVLPTFGNSRTGTAGLQFLKIAPDARALALGGAISAIAADATAIYWNAAGLVSIEKKYQVAFSGGNYAAAGKWSQIAVACRRKTDRYWGLMINSLDFGQLTETTEFQPAGTGQTFAAGSLCLGLAHARRLTDHFSYGVVAKWAREGIATIATNALLFDLAFRYEIGLKNAAFAVSLSNFGLNVRPGGSFETINLTGHKTITDFEKTTVPGIFRLGAAFDPINKEQHRLTLSGQLNHYTDNNETLAMAAEYTWKKILILRLGHQFGADERAWPSSGLGLLMFQKKGILRLDYSIAPHLRLGTQHLVSLLLTPKK